MTSQSPHRRLRPMGSPQIRKHPLVARCDSRNTLIIVVTKPDGKTEKCEFPRDQYWEVAKDLVQLGSEDA